MQRPPIVLLAAMFCACLATPTTARAEESADDILAKVKKAVETLDKVNDISKHGAATDAVILGTLTGVAKAGVRGASVKDVALHFADVDHYAKEVGEYAGGVLEDAAKALKGLMGGGEDAGDAGGAGPDGGGKVNIPCPYCGRMSHSLLEASQHEWAHEKKMLDDSEAECQAKAAKAHRRVEDADDELGLTYEAALMRCGLYTEATVQTAAEMASPDHLTALKETWAKKVKDDRKALAAAQQESNAQVQEALAAAQREIDDEAYYSRIAKLIAELKREQAALEADRRRRERAAAEAAAGPGAYDPTADVLIGILSGVLTPAHKGGSPGGTSGGSTAGNQTVIPEPPRGGWKVICHDPIIHSVPSYDDKGSGYWHEYYPFWYGVEADPSGPLTRAEAEARARSLNAGRVPVRHWVSPLPAHLRKKR